MEDQLSLYLSYLTRRKSGKTVKLYGWVASKFADFMKSQGITAKELKLIHVEKFLSMLDVSDRSLAVYSYALANFLEFIGLSDLARKVPVTRYEVKEPKWLEREQVMKIIEACENPIHKALLWTSYELALRVGEAVRLKWEDVDLENRTVAVTRLKKKRVERKIKPISRELARFLMTLPQHCEYVFPSYGGRGKPGWHMMSETMAEKIFRDAAAKVGLKGYTFHTLRHSRATEIAMRTGGNPIDVAKVTDHDNPANVLIYCHIALRRLREITGTE